MIGKRGFTWLGLKRPGGKVFRNGWVAAVGHYFPALRVIGLQRGEGVGVRERKGQEWKRSVLSGRGVGGGEKKGCL